MAVLSLPLTFTNSFWTQDYRRGLHVLYDKLEQGVAENEEIVAFIKARAAAERNIAESLISPLPTGKRGLGFEADDGASLLMAFRGLQVESATQGQAHSNVAKELTTLVADPFQKWASGYKERLKQSKAHLLDDWLPSYEQSYAGVATLKQQYLAKVRKADEAEDDAKFAPTSKHPTSDKFTNSPRLRPADRAPPQRTPSVSERITQRLKEIQKRSVDTLAQVTASEDVHESLPPELEVEQQEKPLAKVDKGKGKGKEVDTTENAILESPPPLTPSPPPKDAPPSLTVQATIVLADLSFTPLEVTALLIKASTELPLRPVRFPLLGEYQDAFSGDELVAWLKVNVAGLDKSLDKAEEMARDLTEREGLLRRLGELGNSFEDSEEAFYQFRPKAFQIEKLDPSVPQADNLMKRTGTLYSFVSKALNANTSSSEPAHIRARQEASEADNTYRVSVRKLDRHRLALEERIEEALKVLQRWEIERLFAVKTVLLQYHGTLSNLPKSFEPSLERSTTLLSAFQPEQDLIALVERYRTGSFRPNPHVYESVSHEELDVVFGIDLRKWSEGGWFANFASMQSDEEEKKQVTKKDLVPPVVVAMLDGLESAYAKSPNDAEKRKAWIYDVPLGAVHQLRENLNSIPSGQPYPPDIFAKFDPPVIAACIKLWALELNPPLGMYEGWEEFRKLYQARKNDSDAASGDDPEKEHLEKVAATLQRLPRVHLYVLDAILIHLRRLVATTKVEESDEVYFTKLGLSMGRSILRPKVETELSIQDRHPSSLVIDLLTHYDTILPPTIERKKRESERKLPMRKRTAPTDMRLSRSKITFGADAAQLLAAQQVAQNPSLATKGVKSPEMPSLPLQASPPVAAARVPSPASNLPVPPPPPPPILNQLKTPPPPVSQVIPSPPSRTSASPIPPPPPLSGRPTFKEPPPEFDVLPARPSFKEPPPELDDLPPRPSFVDPPPEDGDEPVSSTTSSTQIPPSTNVIPPTPQKATSRVTSRSPTPSNAGSEDVVLGTGKPSISRVGSGPASSGIRGPRMTRGVRPVSSNVQNLVQNLNRNSVTGSPGPVPASPKTNRFSGSGSTSSTGSRVGSPVRRPSSIVGRNATSFSRRTMASDAEDDVVDRK